MFFGAFWRLP